MGKANKILVAMFDPFCRQPPEFPAQCGNIPMLNLQRETKELKSENQIVSPKDHFHIRCVGPETSGWDLGHVIRVLEFAEKKFLETPVAIKPIDGFRGQVEVICD